jgi:hypothetical protein
MLFPKYSRIIAFLAFLLSITITSCITEKKMNRYVTSRYGETVKLQKLQSDYITINTTLNTENPVPSESTKKTKKALPFILYMRFYYQTSCTLNPIIPINQFNAAFSSYANSKKLGEKLKGRKLELSIDNLPLTFSFNDDYQFLIIIQWERIYLLPQNQEMVLTYKITGEGAGNSKIGTITIPDPNTLKGTRYFQSVKSATREYLTQYDEHIKTMAKTAVDELMKDL